MSRRPFDFRRGARTAALLPSLLGVSALCASSDVTSAQTVAPRTWGFVSTRTDSRSSDALYTAYGYGPVFAVGALLDNRRTGFAEQVVGVGVRGSLGGAGSQLFAATMAKATESRYVELYYVPTLVFGAVTVGTTIIGDIPLQPTGYGQLLLTPLSGMVHVRGPLSLGASYEMNAAERAATSHAAGPSARLTLPNAELGAELLCGMHLAANKLRMSFRAFY